MKAPTQTTYTPKPRERAVAVAGPSRAIVAMPKDAPVRSEAYRRLVAAMDCLNCGNPGPSQCAHADEGKGLGIKSDDRTCYPACATKPGRVGCHDLIGASGLFTRDERRKVEQLYGAKTRAAILASGRWPTAVPLWSEA